MYQRSRSDQPGTVAAVVSAFRRTPQRVGRYDPPACDFVPVPGVGILLIGASVGLVAQNPPSDNSARNQLHQFIDGLAHTDFTARSSAIAQVTTRQDAERRRTATREKLRRLIGGLPEHSAAWR